MFFWVNAFVDASAHPILQLDITTSHMIPFDQLIRSTPADRPGVLYDFLDAVLARPQRVMRDLGYSHNSFEMHDPLAAFYVVHTARSPEDDRWQVVKRNFIIERHGEWTKGSFRMQGIS
jgi:hypothetical protein